MTGSRQLVVLAEDDRELRKLLARALEHEGFDVDESPDAGGAIDRIASRLVGGGRAPSAIVTDVLMPGVSGLELLESLARAGCSCPVVVITAFGSEATHERARELGAAAVFDKPFDVDDLVAKVRELASMKVPEAAVGSPQGPALFTRRPTGT